MNGLPSYLNTKQDFVNLLSIPEYREYAIAELRHVRDLHDSKITKCTTQIDPNDSESEWNTIKVVNTNPKWKRMKFESKKEVADLLAAAEAIPKW